MGSTKRHKLDGERTPSAKSRDSGRRDKPLSEGFTIDETESSSSSEELVEDDQVIADAMDESAAESDDPPTKAFRIGVDNMNDDEVLEYEESAYNIFYKFGVGHSCRAFDFIVEPTDPVQKKGPYEFSLVAGTEAEDPKENSILVAHISHIGRTYYSSDTESDDDDENTNGGPQMKFSHISYPSGCNVIKSCPVVSRISACYYQDSMVHVYDTDVHQKISKNPKYVEKHPNNTPLYSHSCDEEGYALEWQKNNILTGSRNSKINYFKAVAGGWSIDHVFDDHQSSIESIAVSYNDDNIFASGDINGVLNIFDLRLKKRVGGICRNKSDINALKFNHENNFLLSGHEDGHTYVMDLRMIEKPLACHSFHSQNLNVDSRAILSVDWHPTDNAMYLAAARDDTVTLWDLSVEALTPQHKMSDYPDQLMFQHAGQAQLAAAKWHPRIPGLILSTGVDCMNLFMPYNLKP